VLEENKYLYMARTSNPSLPIYSYTVTSYTYIVSPSANGIITFNLALSAETASTISASFSGDTTFTMPTLSGVLITTDVNTVSTNPNSLTSTNIVYNWGSNSGGTRYNGYVAAGTITGPTSSFTATIRFNAVNMLTNTVFYLSGNKSSVAITSDSSTDNPLYTCDIITNDADQTNTNFRTVGEHVRRWNLNG
jgi:hypothetical protein